MLDARLASEIEIIHLIYVKYNDQQRSQTWWKYIAILHRRLYRMLRHRKLDTQSAHFIQKRLVPSTARALHGVLAQGAFITLGFALLAALSRVYMLLSDLAPLPSHTTRPPPVDFEPMDDVGEPVDEPPPKDAAAEPLKRLNLSEPSDQLPRSKQAKSAKPASDAKKPHKKDKKKKSKKNRDAIDDIFG